MDFYTVQEGDSPQKIAEKFTANPNRVSDLLAANSEKELISLNGIPTFASIRVGEQLRVPQSWQSLGAIAQYHFYTVRAGDTSASIARGYVGFRYAYELVAANPWKAVVWNPSTGMWDFQTLTVGEKLRLPLRWTANLVGGDPTEPTCPDGEYLDSGGNCRTVIQEACAPGYHRVQNGFCVRDDVPPPPPQPPPPPGPQPPPPPPPPAPPTPPAPSPPAAKSDNTTLILVGLGALALIGLAVAASSSRTPTVVSVGGSAPRRRIAAPRY